MAASRIASVTYTPRQLSCPASADVSGAKMVLANPAGSVSVVSACTRGAPYQAVSEANAGG